MSTFPILRGLCTYLPGGRHALAPQRAVKCETASYSYGVWLKHLTLLWRSGMREIPRTLVELGPGDSIGVGIAALLSGVESYSGVDPMPFAKVRRNLTVFNELVRMFQARAGRPTKGWPDFDKCLDENLFPSRILTEEVLQRSLTPQRLHAIREAILHGRASNGKVNVQYYNSEMESSRVPRESADLVISHSVLEHVDDLDSAFHGFAICLRPGGWMSHQVDLTSHDLTRKWNGHWALSELLWKIIRGKRPYLINRQPCSRYLELLEKHGFRKECLLKLSQFNGISPSRTAARWRHLTSDDLSCAGLFIQARKWMHGPWFSQ
jgi:SAM-dependent methyltransferase